MSKTEQLRGEIANLIFKDKHPGFEWEHTVGWQPGDYSWDREREQCLSFADKILQLLIKAKCVFVAGDQTVPRAENPYPYIDTVEREIFFEGRDRQSKIIRKAGFHRTEPIVREE